jgi:hypothetical protein
VDGSPRAAGVGLATWTWKAELASVRWTAETWRSRVAG